jgi:DNA-binding GntR family transcriptional regulator
MSAPAVLPAGTEGELPKASSEITSPSNSDLASLANMSQELTGPHAPYMLIVYALADKIKSGELKPGERVPSVTELVGTYSVSHSTARRALAKLKDMGLTDTVPGYATFVRLPDQDRA